MALQTKQCIEWYNTDKSNILNRNVSADVCVTLSNGRVNVAEPKQKAKRRMASIRNITHDGRNALARTVML